MELTARAFRAYYMTARKLGGAIDQPANTSGVQEINGLRHIVLENGYRTLAVYRVRNDGRLKALRRWPRELREKH